MLGIQRKLMQRFYSNPANGNEPSHQGKPLIFQGRHLVGPEEGPLSLAFE